MKPARLVLGIPVYNQADTIAETVASALAQTDPFDEIVVVENHSTDGTAERLKSFGGRIRVIHPPQHLGMVQNWNFCVENIRGEWFSLLSGDDLLKPEFARSIKAAIKGHPNAALVRTDWEVIDAAGNVRQLHRQLSVSRITEPPKTWQEQLYGPKVSFAAFAAKRSLWEAVGGFPSGFHLLQDWMFWLKLAPFGAFIRIPEALAQYRSHERPELESRRAALRLIDEHRYLMEILPSLPWGAFRARGKIRTARKRRLRGLLNFLARYPEVTEMEECRAKLAELAHSAGMGRLYEAWLAKPYSLNPPVHQCALLGVKQLVRHVVG